MKHFFNKLVWVAGLAIMVLLNSTIAQAQTIDLSTHQPTATAPTGSQFEWHNALPVSPANLMTPAQIAAAGQGLYFGVYHFLTENCYSAPSPLRIAVAACPATTVDIRMYVDSTGKQAGTFVTWHSNAPPSSSNQITSAAAAIAPAGTYYATYFDPVGNCYSAYYPIIVLNSGTCCPAAPGIGAVNQPDCSGTVGAVTLTGLPASGTWTINISPAVPGATGVAGTGTSTIIGNLPQGTYTFTVTSNGCTSPASSSVLIARPVGCPVCPTATPVANDITVCDLAAHPLNLFTLITNSAPPAVPHWFSDALGRWLSDAEAAAITTPGNYTARFWDAAFTCFGPAKTITVTNSILPAPAIGTITQPACPVASGSVILSGLPAGTAWAINIIPAVPGATGVTGTSATTTVGNLPAGSYRFSYTIFLPDAPSCTSATTVSNVVINAITCPTTGVIDCNKTRLVPCPVAGVPSQLDLVVTVNVTSPGCFTPIAVSGSGFSIASGITQVCTNRTGVQEFHIPVNYNGAVLSSLNFTIGQAGSCVADLTKLPKGKEVTVWTLDNCTPPNKGPVLQ